MPKQIKAATAPTKRSVGPAQPPHTATRPETTPAPAPQPSSDSVTSTQPPQVSAFQPRVYQPQDIACCHQNDDLTNCGAEEGEPCKWQQSGMEGTFHAERVADAAAASQREGVKPTKQQFEQAVEDSDLV